MKADGSMAVNEWIDGKYYVDANGKWVTGATAGGWKHSAAGWWYQNADGTYPANCWKQISGKWYHFNKQGYMQTGWLYTGGKWYYLDDSSGHMLTNTWVKGVYYMKADGTMAQNEWIGKYHVGADGKWDATIGVKNKR